MKKVSELTPLDMAVNRATSWLNSSAGYVADIAVLGALSNAQDAVQEALRLAVADARSKGLSWSDIGGALGVSKQAASQRYGKSSPN